MRIIDVFLILLILAGCETGGSGPGSYDRYNEFYSLEDALAHKEYANILFLSNVDSLSPSIGELSNLAQLYIWGGDIEYLPDELLDLPYLYYVGIKNCKFTHIPPQIYLSKSLSIVSLDNMNVGEIPVDFRSLSPLLFLELTSAGLKVFPDSNVSLSRLRGLNLSGNKLTDFHLRKEQVPDLKDLELYGNPIPDTARARIRRQLPDVDIAF